MAQRILKAEELQRVLDLENFILILVFILGAWIFYKLFLPSVSGERHKNLKNHFWSLSRHLLILTILIVTFNIIPNSVLEISSFGRIHNYIGLLATLWGIIVITKASRLWVLMYLFLGSMQAGVPLLIVNIFSLIISIILSVGAITILYGVQLGPILATSAVFSVVLGLAMQDTLGNLFAGISLQIDKTFQIGDWLEVVNGSQKSVGQVLEISWRSTVLLGWTDETIILPNRILAQSQIYNFSPKTNPIWRNQTFRLPYDVNQKVAREAIMNSLQNIPGIILKPEPIIIISDHTDSWLLFKVVYCINSYGSQYIVGDKVICNVLENFKKVGIQVQITKIEINNPNTSGSPN